MAEGAGPVRPNRHLLVVEDEAVVGMGLVSYLEELGATVTWTANVEDSLAAIDEYPGLDAAVVDLNLGGVMSTPVLDRLVADGVFTVLCTGYDITSIDDRFRALPRTEKPFTRAAIRTLLAGYL